MGGGRESRGGNYYPTRGYLSRPNSVESGLKPAPLRRVLGAGRVGFGFGFKANPLLPYPHPIFIFNLYIYDCFSKYFHHSRVVFHWE